MPDTRREELWKLLEETQGRIAAELRRMLNEPAIDPVNFTPENQRRRIESMIQCAAESTTDEERHDKWVRKHESEGWQFGDTFDSALKTHPNLVPWDQLPKPVQSKARIFDLMSKLGRELELLLNPPVLVDLPQNPPDIS